VVSITWAMDGSSRPPRIPFARALYFRALLLLRGLFAFPSRTPGGSISVRVVTGLSFMLGVALVECGGLFV
jgi:hypothetical protein